MKTPSVEKSSARKAEASAKDAALKSLDFLEQMQARLGEVEATQKQVGEVVRAIQDQKDRVSKDLVEYIAAKKNELLEIRKGYDMVVASATATALSKEYNKKATEEMSTATTHSRWFYGALAVLVGGPFVLALWHGMPNDLVGLSMRLLKCLPFYLPILWFACYQNHLATFARRLSEAYSHKSLMAATFQGFAEQVREINDVNAPLAAELKNKMLEALIHVFEQDATVSVKDCKTYLPVTEVTDSGTKLLQSIASLVSECRKERDNDPLHCAKA